MRSPTLSNRNRPALPVARIVAHHNVGDHVVRTTKVLEGRWTVAVDAEEEMQQFFGSQADAWEAGVREIDRRATQS